MGAPPSRLLFQKRPADQLLRFQPHQLQNLGLNQIAFCQHHDAAGNSQQLANLEMFSRLWLDRFVSRNHQQHEIETAGPRQHVAHKSFMPRHVDKTDAHVIQLEKREADIQSNASAFLFLQAVRMGAGESLDQAPICRDRYGRLCQR